MKICLLSRYYNTDNGGIGIYSQNILYELLKRDYRLDLFNTNTGGRVGYFFYTSFELGLKMNFYDNADVYHALTPLESIWTPKEKTVVTFHDLNPWLHRDEATWYGNNPITSRITSIWFQFAVKRATQSKKIICNSDYTRKQIMEYLDVPEEKITVTRLGINPDLEPKNSTSYDNADFTVGTLSYLDPRKRIDALIEAFKELDDPNSELLIPSRGEDKKRLQRLAGEDDRIKFLGYIPEEKKSDYLSSLDVFVLPSKLEGYGLTWIEAMACETPVVSFQDALIPADVQRRTNTVENGKLVDLLDRREFDCDIEENYEFAKKHDWEKCAEETIQVYEEVVG